ncbi:hypothetical protein BHM03_00062407 [Ensete ventricosum]|nr:hypothetical protein BHM03_00062407 [Ensete ventricosum]
MTTGEAAVEASPQRSLASSDRLRHVESMTQLPSGAGQISHLNAVILGEPLASEENDLVFPSHDFSHQALVSSPEQYWKMYKRSVEDPAGFWSEIASQYYWREKWYPEVYSENIDVSKGTVKFEVGCNVEAGNGGKVAIYWEGNEPGDDGQLTYAELLEKVCQFRTTVLDCLHLPYPSELRCTADCGWITGHSYVTYGPLLNGATVVVFEGVLPAPNYPDSGRCWDIVDKYKVTIFYTAPTLVRSLMREGNEVKDLGIFP